MQKFQTVSYVFGLVLAVVIVAGLGAKVGEPVVHGASEGLCPVGPEEPECPTAMFSPTECLLRYSKPTSIAWTLTHESYKAIVPHNFDQWSVEEQREWVLTHSQCTQDVQRCGPFESEYELIGENCIPYAVGDEPPRDPVAASPL